MKFKNIILSLLFVISFVCSSFRASSPIEGLVVAVKDGDTIEILMPQNKRLTIRLNDIDCPEKKQAFGQRAKQFTADFCFNKTVKIVGAKKDRYGRTLAYVYNTKGENLNYKLVEQGMAWRYKYAKSKELLVLEQQAKKQKRGLWIDKNPVSPWDFRKSKSKINI